MVSNRLIVTLVIALSFAGAALGDPRGGQGGKGGADQASASSSAQATATTAATGTQAQNQGGGSQVVLDPANVQSGSAADGQGQASGVAAGQAASATDPANFINFCTGKTLTNGAQVKGGSCNGIPMGDIPATTNMVSTIITNPAPGQALAANTDFNVNLQVANLNAGVFTNPTVTYYTAPQALKNGNIVGHVHVTIQSLGANLAPAVAPDATKFVFFKGIDDAGDGKGGLAALVKGGLPAGNYRVCTMSAAANHQPVAMPVAQRGAQDDCTKFTVGGGGGGGGGGGAKAGGGDKATPSKGGSANPTGTAGAASPSTSATGGGAGGGNGQQGQQQGQEQGQQQGGQRRGRRYGFPSYPFEERAYIV